MNNDHKKHNNVSPDFLIVESMKRAGVDIICSVPCNLLAGILAEIDRRGFTHIRVCREEEGVGIAAGAALAGKRSLLLMQNSGLGNSLNALVSLTALYRLPLFLLMSRRGGSGEQISAQMPMGCAAPRLLRTLGIEYCDIRERNDIRLLARTIRAAYARRSIQAAFLWRELWQ
ncbi:MAG: sulfopyruvate decarboxylase subunit alpha [Desulfobacterota bacterium]|nr:sulfopyruvate decarboxylase subunit alpha [Thermodesulfobacteriota bacterium]